MESLGQSVFKLEFLQITLLPNQNWGRIQGLRRGDEQEGQGARGGGADLAGDNEHRRNRRRRRDGSRRRRESREPATQGWDGSGRRRTSPGRRGAGHGSPAGRRIARSERSAQGRRKAGPRDRGCGRSVTSWGRKKKPSQGTGRRENRTEVARRGVGSGPGLGYSIARVPNGHNI